jgi:hypothetical protein
VARAADSAVLEVVSAVVVVMAVVMVLHEEAATVADTAANGEAKHTARTESPSDRVIARCII